METYQNILTKAELIRMLALISLFAQSESESEAITRGVSYTLAALVANNTHPSGQTPEGVGLVEAGAAMCLHLDLSYEERLALAEKYVETRWARDSSDAGADVRANPVSEPISQRGVQTEFYPIHIFQVWRRGSFSSYPHLVLAPDIIEAQQIAMKNAPLGGKHWFAPQQEVLILDRDRGPLSVWKCAIDHPSAKALRAHGELLRAQDAKEAERIIRWVYLIPDAIAVTMTPVNEGERQ